MDIYKIPKTLKYKILSAIHDLTNMCPASVKSRFEKLSDNCYYEVLSTIVCGVTFEFYSYPDFEQNENNAELKSLESFLYKK